LDKHIRRYFCDPIKIVTGDAILKPADGGLAGQLFLIGQPLTGYFHDRIFPQLIAVISILITAENLENPLLEKLKKLMFGITGMAAIPQRISHFADQTYPVFNLPEEKKPGIKTDLTAIEISFNFLIGNAFKKEQLFGTIFHGCFLFFLVLKYYISILYEGKKLFL
jgi:hypothetical protein